MKVRKVLLIAPAVRANNQKPKVIFCFIEFSQRSLNAHLNAGETSKKDE